MKYNKLPKTLGVFDLTCNEVMNYLYLHVKLRGAVVPVFEPRLTCFERLIGAACCDYIANYGMDRYIQNTYVYLTAKRDYQSQGHSFNRPGWHSDGFMTDDVSYIWSDCQPTLFNDSDFDLSQDDSLSMLEMEAQADPANNFTYPDKSLIKMDQFSIHKVGEPITGMRTFVKVCFSKDKYDLQGNSHNYLLNYDWPMRPRGESRNVPQELEK